jgi:hypothetical protein
MEHILAIVFCVVLPFAIHFYTHIHTCMQYAYLHAVTNIICVKVKLYTQSRSDSTCHCHILAIWSTQSTGFSSDNNSSSNRVPYYIATVRVRWREWLENG